ncbi:MAG TPA: M23 family metallopeptidase [Gemmatimonadaceae bacterium]|nr:M23 family metallopeptidase [Gemmatimonadaceae bacterium]
MQQRMRGAFAALLTITISHAAMAQRPRLQVEPRQPATGSLTRLTIDRLASHAGNGSDSIVRVTGTMAGEPLHFRLLDGDRMQALGAIPIDASDSVVAQVVVERQSGALDSMRLALKYPHQAPPVGQSRGRPARASRLRVDPKFTRRLDSATEARIERENELARLVGHRAQDTPQLWTESFARPRQSRVTSRFGTGRVFNGRVSSSHLGIDYRGATGEPIYAANRGVVALVDSFFLAGNVVYIDHGDGIVTGYFHMSLPKVAVGDTVQRGQEIGLVGATGRVTAAHLHWSARFGALTIDPADLLSLKPPFVGSGSAVSGRQ